MANMSYCRFENTYKDLADCVRALEELFNDPDAEISKSEWRFAGKMIDLAEKYIQTMNELHDAGFKSVRGHGTGHDPEDY